jgi:hypothetical protein
MTGVADPPIDNPSAGLSVVSMTSLSDNPNRLPHPMRRRSTSADAAIRAGGGLRWRWLTEPAPAAMAKDAFPEPDDPMRSENAVAAATVGQ